MTETVAVTILNLWHDVIQNVFVQLPTFCLGCKHIIVPYNYDKQVGCDKFWQMIEQKNTFNNKTSAIMLYHFLPETFNKAFQGHTEAEQFQVTP